MEVEVNTPGAYLVRELGELGEGLEE